MLNSGRNRLLTLVATIVYFLVFVQSCVAFISFWSFVQCVVAATFVEHVGFLSSVLGLCLVFVCVNPLTNCRHSEGVCIYINIYIYTTFNLQYRVRYLFVCMSIRIVLPNHRLQLNWLAASVTFFLTTSFFQTCPFLTQASIFRRSD